MVGDLAGDHGPADIHCHLDVKLRLATARGSVGSMDVVRDAHDLAAEAAPDDGPPVPAHLPDEGARYIDVAVDHDRLNSLEGERAESLVTLHDLDSPSTHGGPRPRRRQVNHRRVGIRDCDPSWPCGLSVLIRQAHGDVGAAAAPGILHQRLRGMRTCDHLPSRANEIPGLCVTRGGQLDWNRLVRRCEVHTRAVHV